jgi:hypothetical protein
MPGTPATSPRLAIPRYGTADAPDWAGHQNAVADMIDSKVEKITPLVTTWPPPGTPADNDMVDFQNAAMAAKGVMWRFRYRSAVSLWEFIGGAPLYAKAGHTGFGSWWQMPSISGVWQDPPGGLDCALTVPITAVYVARFRFHYTVSNSFSDSTSYEMLTAAFSKAGVEPLGDSHSTAYNQILYAGFGGYHTPEKELNVGLLNAGEVWGLRYHLAIGDSPEGRDVRNRCLMLTPVYHEVE